MKPRRILLRLFVWVALAGTAGAALWYYTRPRPIPVAVAPVERGTVEATVANTRAGTVEACRRARLAPATGGQISRRLVRKGERVAAGQVLLELWNEDLAAARTLAERQADAARARAEEACVTADEAERDASRLANLRRQGVATQESADRAASEAKARRAGCVAARASAEVSAAQVAVAKANLDRTFLRTPFAGTVAELNGEVGEFVTPSPVGVPTLPAVDLIDTSCLYVSAPMDEVDAPRIRLGMPARVSLDAFPNRRFPGTVRRIAPYVLDVERQARTVEIEVDLTSPRDGDRLMPGYSADVEVVLTTREGVLRIPTEAVIDGRKVLVVKPGDGARVIEERPIESGISSWKYTEVKSGLEIGELVVLSVDRPGVVPGARAEPEPPESGDRGSAPGER